MILLYNDPDVFIHASVAQYLPLTILRQPVMQAYFALMHRLSHNASSLGLVSKALLLLPRFTGLGSSFKFMS
jgi:hypothetical protein